LSRKDGGVDSEFSMEPNEMKQLVIETERAWQSLGEVEYGPNETEKHSLKHRRSLYITKDLKTGDIITSKNLRCIRPGLGLPPKFYEIVLGRKVKRDVMKGEAVTWELIQ